MLRVFCMCRDCYPTDLSGLGRKIADLSDECQTYLRAHARPRYDLHEYDVEPLMDYFREFVTWHPNMGYTRAPSPDDLFQEWADEVRAGARYVADMCNNDILPDDDLFNLPNPQWQHSLYEH